MKKRIAICTPQTPFTRGGAEYLVDKLIEELRKRGHEVDLLQVPVAHTPKVEMVINALTWRMLKIQDILGRDVDVVITTKFPAYLVKHPRKILWLFHQFRGAYELFDTDCTHFRDDPESHYYRNLIQRMDTALIPEHKKIFSLSKNVANRLLTNNKIQSEVLYGPPVLDGFYHRQYGDYLLYVGRFSANKRVRLVLETARQAPEVRFVLAGGGEEYEPLKALAGRWCLNNVEFLGYVPTEKILRLYADARAVIYTPLDEDYGLVPLEAFMARKPVLTTSDSGGILELVKDKETGIICPPSPTELGQRARQLARDEASVESMGRRAEKWAREIGWDRCIERLEAHFE
ncbi:MAG: glycosyltransferase family 4 protein [Acidobacteriota bacterium]